MENACFIFSQNSSIRNYEYGFISCNKPMFFSYITNWKENFDVNERLKKTHLAKDYEKDVFSDSQTILTWSPSDTARTCCSGKFLVLTCAVYWYYLRTAGCSTQITRGVSWHQDLNEEIV